MEGRAIPLRTSTYPRCFCAFRRACGAKVNNPTIHIFALRTRLHAPMLLDTGCSCSCYLLPQYPR